MARGSAARRQAAIAISKKAAAATRKKTKGNKRQAKKKFPGDVNGDGKISGVDFKLARAKGMI